MNRTKNRPLPSGEITPLSAFIISLLLILSGSLFLGYLGAVPLTLGIANVILYNFIYTPLKRLSSAAILPGALVGAVCPLIGSTTGGLPLFDPAVLFISIFVFLWQVPHFWLLLVSYSRDYKRAGFAGIYDFMNLSMIKILVFAWGVISSGFLFSFPLFGLKISHTMAPFLALVNLLFIIAFYKLIFTEKSERSLQKAFILVNSFAVLIFLVFIFGRV